MELFKKDEMKLFASVMRKAFKEVGFKTRQVGEYCKWKNLANGAKLQMTYTVCEIKKDGMPTMYMMSDPLDRVVCPMMSDKQEMLGWLKENGYKPIKQWYIEDYGMTEETWNVWNGEGEKED